MKTLILILLLAFTINTSFSQTQNALLVKVRSDCYLTNKMGAGASIIKKVPVNCFVYIVSYPGQGDNVCVVSDTTLGYVSYYYFDAPVEEIKKIGISNIEENIRYAKNNTEKAKQLSKSEGIEIEKQALSKAHERHIADSLFNRDKIKAALTIKSAGIGVLSFSNLINDYSAGFSITLFNPSLKTIKYTYITTEALNPVNDVVAAKRLQAVGPIYSEESGKYTFDNVFYSRVVEYIMIKKLEVEYSDGTKRIITDPTKVFFTRF